MPRDLYFNVADSPHLYNDELGGVSPAELERMGRAGGNSTNVARLMAATASELSGLGFGGSSMKVREMNDSLQNGVNTLRRKANFIQQEAIRQRQMAETQRQLDELMATKPTPVQKVEAPNVVQAPKAEVEQPKQPQQTQQNADANVQMAMLEGLSAITKSLQTLNNNITSLSQSINDRLPQKEVYEEDHDVLKQKAYYKEDYNVSKLHSARVWPTENGPVAIEYQEMPKSSEEEQE